MVDAEFENIMQQLRHEASHEDDPKAALCRDRKGRRANISGIAERRVRLGLLLSEVGQAMESRSAEQEMNRLIGQAASQYQGKDRERFIQYIQQEPMAAAQLRAPLYEDKVVDFLFSKAEISERTTSRAELEADLESEEGHVHGPGCGHDHAAVAKPAKAKKPPRRRPSPSRKRRPRAPVEETSRCQAEARQAGQGWRRRQACRQEAASRATPRSPQPQKAKDKVARHFRESWEVLFSSRCARRRRDPRLREDEAGGQMTASEPRIAVLLPCFNEEATIAATVAGFRAALPTADHLRL